MRVVFLRSTLVGTHVYDSGDVADIPPDRAEHLLEAGVVREATPADKPKGK